MPFNVGGYIWNGAMASVHDYRSIITRGLVLHIDPSAPGSYGGSGTTAGDLSGEGNNVTMTNANIGTTETDVFSFDSSQYMTFTDGADFTFGTGQFAIEQWLYFTDFAPDGDTWLSSFQIYRVEGDRHGIMLFYSGGASPDWRLESSVNGCYPALIVLADHGVDINEWHYFAVSRESENSFSQYIDGKLIQTMTTANGGTAPRGQTYNTNWAFIDGTGYIGNYASADHHEFEGKIGPTRVYKGVSLSPSQVLHNFNVQRDRFGV